MIQFGYLILFDFRWHVGYYSHVSFSVSEKRSQDRTAGTMRTWWTWWVCMHVCVCVCTHVHFKASATSLSRSLQAHKLREATQPELTGCWTVPSCCRFIFPVASVCACSVTSVVSGSLQPLLERCSDSSSLPQGSFCFASAQLQQVY